MKTQIVKVKAKTIFTRTKLSGAKWVVNQYVGCEHSCRYCLDGNSIILMHDGSTKLLKNIRVGDKVCGVWRNKNTAYHYYKITQVLAHWKIIKPAIKVITEQGIEVVCSPDHRWFSNRGWKHTIGAMQGLSRRPYLTESNAIHGVGALTMASRETDLYMKGYLSGMIRGDGLLKIYDYSGKRRGKDIQYQFRLALKDREAVDRVYNYLSKFGVKIDWFKFQIASGNRVNAIRKSNKKTYQAIKNLIKFCQKSEYQRGFIAGIFDAEGTAGTNNSLIRIFNSDKQLLQFTITSLRYFDFNVVDEKHGEYCRSLRVRGGIKEYIRFFQLVNPAIKRKFNITGMQVKSSFKIKEIIDLQENREMFDITTGIGTFIANGLVSHNCYAKFMARWRPNLSGEWGSRVEAKINAPELVKGKFMDGWVFMSSVSDPYQQAEKKLKLTRQILENMNKRIKLVILTKSDLILRDIDILRQFKDIEIGFTINSFAGKAKRFFEPDSPTNKKRIQALKILKENNFKVYAFVSPIIPELIDLKDVIKQTKKWADYYWFEFINLRGAGKEFTDILKKEFPRSYKVLTNKSQFTQFIQKSKKIIKTQNIKTKGIELH